MRESMPQIEIAGAGGLDRDAIDHRMPLLTALTTRLGVSPAIEDDARGNIGLRVGAIVAT